MEQALYGPEDGKGYRLLARSSGFTDDWLPVAERLCSAFDEGRDGAACPDCVFARPLDHRHVAIVQAAGHGAALSFRFIIVDKDDYLDLGGDPFFVADQFPPNWQACGELPALEWPQDVSAPPRAVAQVQRVLQRPEGPSLLGGAQVLVDGGRLVFVRATADAPLLRDLWALLPWRTRAQLWPATFAFGNTLGFDVLVVPRVAGRGMERHVAEEQAGEYPEGRYERNLQIAAEAGDQDSLDSLFARRTSGDTIRLAMIIIVGVLCLALMATCLLPSQPPATTTARKSADPPRRDALPALPPVRTLDAAERERLARALLDLSKKLGLPVAADATPEKLLRAIDEHLSSKDKARDPRPLASFGPIEWQLRVLLWKEGLEEHRKPGATAVELVERLEKKLVLPPSGEKKSGD
jgi:hypothetical protein